MPVAQLMIISTPQAVWIATKFQAFHHGSTQHWQILPRAAMPHVYTPAAKR